MRNTPPPLTIIQPNGGEVWLMGSVHEIKWEGTNLKHSDHLIIQYSRDGGVSWFRIAQDVPALSFSYSWQVDNYPTTQGRVKILLQGNRSITDQSDANFTVQPNSASIRRSSKLKINKRHGTGCGKQLECEKCGFEPSQAHFFLSSAQLNTRIRKRCWKLIGRKHLRERDPRHRIE